MSRILTIARLTFLEARRRKIVPAALACGLLFLLVFGTALYFMAHRFAASGGQREAEVQFVTLAGLYVANFLTVAFGVLLPVDTLSGEIGSGVMQTLASKPVSRAEIVLGKWLTFWLMIGAYLALTAGGIVLIVHAITGFPQPRIWVALPLMLLGATLMLNVSLAGGARLTTVANGIVAFAFYGIAFIGGWIEQIGTFTRADSARYIGTAISLLSPIDALWRRAAYELQAPLTRGLLQLSPFGATNVPSNAMIAWALGLGVVLLLVALRQFKRRPL